MNHLVSLSPLSIPRIDKWNIRVESHKLQTSHLHQKANAESGECDNAKGCFALYYVPVISPRGISTPYIIQKNKQELVLKT